MVTYELNIFNPKETLIDLITFVIKVKTWRFQNRKSALGLGTKVCQSETFSVPRTAKHAPTKLSSRDMTALLIDGRNFLAKPLWGCDLKNVKFQFNEPYIEGCWQLRVNTTDFSHSYSHFGVLYQSHFRI